jgi:REP element-mobilizing transposase RayT
MPQYRRNRIEGGIYFFTLALADRRSDLLVKEVDALRASVSRAHVLYPFTIDAWVVLPDHLHAVWTLPADDADFSTRWTLIKRGFSAGIAAGESRSASRLPRESGGSGSGVFENIRYAMRLISGGTSICPFQPGQAWAGWQCLGLAVFIVPAGGDAGELSSRLGRRG